MKRILTVGAALAVAATVAGTALAATPVPFPSAKVGQVFVAAQTVTTDGSLSSWFAPGSTVVFRAYAVDPATKQLVDPKLVKYFYVAIPNEPSVKLTYGATAPGASSGLPWTGSWSVPAGFKTGVVGFKVLIQIREKGKPLKGEFVQMPVSTSQLNVAPTVPAAYTPAASAGTAGAGASGSALAASLYVDSVAGSGPVGIGKRPIGCSQSNVYKRGEQVVVRAWGTELATTDVLSTDNVDSAHFSIAGVPDVTLNYGPHGTVEFWANAWVIPANYPLGATTIHVVFNLSSGKTAAYDYVINVIPS